MFDLSIDTIKVVIFIYTHERFIPKLHKLFLSPIESFWK